MIISTLDLQNLANKIVEKIKEDFEVYHISKNLINTIKITQTSRGIDIDIPAEIYDLQRWYKDRVIVYNGNGSYAQEVDERGGFSGTHTNYVEDAIKSAIKEWISEKNLKVKEINII